jgi:deazaflavin-dependent oxidoreductase (nitroreductase family)
MPTKEQIVESITGNVRNHIQTYLESNGEDGHIYRGNPTLLLTTRGRKSGLLRRQALIYGTDGDRYVVVASNRGSSRFPAWYLNLRKDPEVHIQVANDRFTAIACEISGEERQRLWNLMIEVYPSFLRYREKTDRPFPIIIFERVTR